MKFVNVLLLSFLAFTLEQKSCYIEKYVRIDTPTTVSSKCFYLDLSEFSGYLNLMARVTVKNGHFTEERMYYGGYYSTPSSWSPYTLNVYSSLDSEDYSNRYGSDYGSQTYYFKVPTLDFTHMFLRVPDHNYGDIEVECTTSGLNYGAIVAIVAVAIIVIGVPVGIYVRHRRRARLEIVTTAPGVISSPLV